MTHTTRKHRIAGFTLTEMAIVLGVVGVLVAGLWNLISGASQQARDESAASQQTQLIAAIKGFLYSSQGQSYMTQNSINTANGGCNGALCAANSTFSLPLPTSTTVCNDFADTNWKVFCSFLPPGFTKTTVNSYGQTFLIRIMRDGTPNPDAGGNPTAPNSYSFMVMTTGGSNIPDTDGSRIAALIGGDGGFIYNNVVCNAANTTTACGSYGGWSYATTGAGSYGFLVASAAGTIASRTYMTPQQNALSDWLARVNMPGDTTHFLNTMQTSEYLGGFDLNLGSYASPLANGGAGNFNVQGGAINFAIPGATTGGGTLNAAGGVINMQAGVINLGGGTIQSVNGTPVGNDAIILNTTNGNGNPDITANFPCVVNSYNPNYYGAGSGQSIIELPSAGDTGPGQGTPCNFAVKATSITVDGIVYANGFYAGTFIYNASDASLKKDIRPLIDPLKHIDKLNPVSFEYKANNQSALGVVAQDVEKVYPELVAYGKDGKKFVNYEGLIAPLIGAVQELKHENDDLRQRLEETEARQEKLENELHHNHSR